jgi:hypothetical protein
MTPILLWHIHQLIHTHKMVTCNKNNPNNTLWFVHLHGPVNLQHFMLFKYLLWAPSKIKPPSPFSECPE